jgi:hypothetical protein
MGEHEILSVAPGSPMSWVTIIWAIVASACLTLAALNLLGWREASRPSTPRSIFDIAHVMMISIRGCSLFSLEQEIDDSVQQ